MKVDFSCKELDGICCQSMSDASKIGMNVIFSPKESVDIRYYKLWLLRPSERIFQGPARLGKTKTPSGRYIFGFGDQTSPNLEEDRTMMNGVTSRILSLLIYL